MDADLDQDHRSNVASTSGGVEMPNVIDEKVAIRLDRAVLTPLPIQIAGHGTDGDGRREFMKHPDGRIMKPRQPSPRGEREVSFYRRINDSQDPVDAQIRQVIPEFYGVAKTTVRNGEVTASEDFLLLRDITEGFALPAVMDIKLGSRTWGPDATEKKRIEEDSKYVGTKHPLGFSVLGMIVHSLRPEDEGNNKADGLRHGKSFGKTLKTEDVEIVPRTFFDVERSGLEATCIEIMLEKMQKILNIFEAQTKYRLFSSSLLMAYDADAVRKYRNGKVTRGELENFVNVKLIDFAHVFDANGEKDENFLRGLRNVIKLFTDSTKM